MRYNHFIVISICCFVIFSLSSCVAEIGLAALGGETYFSERIVRLYSGPLLSEENVVFLLKESKDVHGTVYRVKENADPNIALELIQSQEQQNLKMLLPGEVLWEEYTTLISSGYAKTVYEILPDTYIFRLVYSKTSVSPDGTDINIITRYGTSTHCHLLRAEPGHIYGIFAQEYYDSSQKKRLWKSNIKDLTTAVEYRNYISKFDRTQTVEHVSLPRTRDE